MKTLIYLSSAMYIVLCIACIAFKQRREHERKVKQSRQMPPLSSRYFDEKEDDSCPL